MGASEPITIDRLVARIRDYEPYAECDDAEGAAYWIGQKHLHDVIAGRSEGKPVTFARAFEVVFGRRLGGSK